MNEIGMSCSEVRARLMNYIDEDLSDEERLFVELHIHQCYACREELDELGRLLELCGAALRHPYPHDRFEELKQRLASAEPQYKPVLFRRNLRTRDVLYRLAVAAVIIAVIAASPFLVKGFIRLFRPLEDSAVLADNGLGLGRLHLPFELPFVEQKRKIEEATENSKARAIPADRANALKNR